MSNTTLARPYAQAAFEYAQAHQSVSAWQDALGTLATLAKHPEIKQVAHAPQFSSDEFENLVASFVNAKEREPLRNFIHTVIEHGRFFVMPEISDGFIARHNASDTVLPVTVTSAVALTDAEKAKIVQKLEAKTEQKVSITYAQDPALLGGFVIRYGDQVIDASLKYRLAELAHCLS
ncbi:MAG: F0F1 ATP synthase subunit delta [Gammaproteobacteria bacterium]